MYPLPSVHLANEFRSRVPFRLRGSRPTLLGGAVLLLGALLLGAVSADPVAATTTPSDPPVYRQIRIPAPLSDRALELIRAEQLELMGQDDGGYLFLLPAELAGKLEDAGLEYELQVDDLAAYYRDRLVAERLARGDGTTGGGNFGIFHTYDETVAELNAIHAEFPSITTAPFSIGQSIEGREMWAIKVSDNPDVDEDEGEILFDGCHHAREIMTVEMLLDFSRYLCENYGSDPVVTQLVDSREVFFVPIVNPDGFAYNELTDPLGGGMWRKNRRDNVGSCYGVDLNRNYDYEWVGSGSSTDPCNDTYRGTAPESEPEVAAHTAFIDSHEFVVWQSYHSVAALVLYPWGYTSSDSPDEPTYQAMADVMSADNGYQTGQAPDLLYPVNGVSFDWGYGATNRHPRIFSFTTEIGGSGFWPLESERDGLIAENLSANLYLCKVAGTWIDLATLAVDDGGDGLLVPGETGDLVVTVSNPSVLVEATGVTATLRCDDPYVTLLDAVSVIGSVPTGGQTTGSADPFTVTVDPSCPEGRSVTFLVDLSADGGFATTGSVELFLGSGNVIAHQDFETGAEGWSTDPTHTATTGAFVSIDPNPTDFQPGDDTTPDPGIRGWITGQNSALGTDDVDGGVSATRSATLDLSSYASARLQLDYFFGQRDPGGDAGDFFRLSLSNDGGATFPVDLVSVGDQYSPANWQRLSVVVDDLLALTSQMVLRVQAADGTATGDIVEAGIDEVSWLDNGSGNEPPSAPILVSPADGSDGQPAFPTLVVSNAIDPEGDSLTYGFRVWSDPELTQLVASTTGVPAGVGTTGWTVDVALGEGQTYYWRAFAADAESYGAYMDAASFQVGDVTDSPEVDGLTAPQLLAGPSPSGSDVRIRYYTPAAVHSDLAIFDAAGRQVRTLPGARWTEGWQETIWDGRDAGGRRVPAGIYWVRLQLPDQQRTLRVVRVE